MFIPLSVCWGRIPCCRLRWLSLNCWDCWDLNLEHCYREMTLGERHREKREKEGEWGVNLNSLKAVVYRIFCLVFLFFREAVTVSVCVCFLPDISMALFLKVLMTVPSFLRRSGELRLSATFCFNRERTFRFGSETRWERGYENCSVCSQETKTVITFSISDCHQNCEEENLEWKLGDVSWKVKIFGG